MNSMNWTPLTIILWHGCNKHTLYKYMQAWDSMKTVRYVLCSQSSQFPYELKIHALSNQLNYPHESYFHYMRKMALSIIEPRTILHVHQGQRSWKSCFLFCLHIIWNIKFYNSRNMYGSICIEARKYTTRNKSIVRNNVAVTMLPWYSTC